MKKKISILLAGLMLACTFTVVNPATRIVCFSNDPGTTEPL
ncbi:hypothetical protein [Inconstantimicrobium mannanitabidum]|nr:hypothetical protein [Clostridium sp. TW13]